MPSTQEILESGLARHRSGDVAGAAAAYQRVLDTDPENADALHLLGVARQQSGDAAAGEALMRRAIAARPDAPPFHNNLGKLLADQRRWSPAIAAYRRAIELAPGYGEAHFNLGVALQAMRDLTGAEAEYRRAADLTSADLRPLANLGALLKQIGRYDEADAILRGVISREPAHAEALTNLAYIQMAFGDFAQARRLYERAIAARPAETLPFRHLLSCILYDPDLDAETRFAEHRRFAAIFGSGEKSPPPFRNTADPSRKLRIGWLSADLYDHPVARNLEPLFAGANLQGFEHIFYAEPDEPNEVQGRLKAIAAGWRPTAGRRDEEVAEQIRSDAIDILIVLAGRFDRNRPLVAAYRGAPVQVSLFDAATSGLPEIDYFIADSVMVPPRPHRYERFTERPLRLPNFYVHRPLKAAPVLAPPFARGRPVAFGCFNNPIKINQHVLEVWARLLARIPSARLVLKYLDLFRSPAIQARIVDAMAKHGIDPVRIEMGGTLESSEDHLARYGQIDIALDPFPFNGSTSTFEALWMGVPVVSLLGDSFMSRWTASMLHKVGHPEWVASTADQYIDIAAELAADVSCLTGLRSTLRQQLATSILCDPRRTMHYLERVLRAIWRKWCLSGPAEQP